MSKPLPALRLKKNEERRLQAGHLWVFSNEIDVRATPLTGFEPGELVSVQSSRGARLGVAYVNPRSLISARLLSRDPVEVPTLLRARVAGALALRERLYTRPFYRLLNAEGDLLPGIIVDRFDDVLVVQVTTLGMERLLEPVLAALREVTGLQTVLLRNDAPVRALEGLPLQCEQRGGAPRDALWVEEGDCRFRVPFQGGQKTGWYYDQRDNRLRLRAMVRGQRVLDLYSYSGAWAIHALRGGAREALCVDSSAAALEQVRDNAARNDCAARLGTRQSDVAEALQALREAAERFDVVVVDPPALIKRRRDASAGQAHYRRINRAALRVLREGGILVTCSCSYHMPLEVLRRIVNECARRERREARLLACGFQSLDHPQHPAIPETGYLKALYFAC